MMNFSLSFGPQHCYIENTENLSDGIIILTSHYGQQILLLMMEMAFLIKLEVKFSKNIQFLICKENRKNCRIFSIRQFRPTDLYPHLYQPIIKQKFILASVSYYFYIRDMSKIMNVWV